jgi:hypothetical protein
MRPPTFRMPLPPATWKKLKRFLAGATSRMAGTRAAGAVDKEADTRGSLVGESPVFRFSCDALLGNPRPLELTSRACAFQINEDFPAPMKEGAPSDIETLLCGCELSCYGNYPIAYP